MADTSKILIWFWGRRGGGPLTTRLLTEHLLQAGCSGNLTVSLSAQNEQLSAMTVPGVDVHTVETFDGESLGTLARRIPALRRDFRQLLARVQPDVIVVPMIFAAAPLLLDIARIRVPRLIYAAHDAEPHPGDPGGGRIALMQSLFIRAADEIVAFSEFTANALRRLHPRAANRIFVEPLAGLYRPRAAPRSAPSDRPLRFLAPGRLVQYKGFERLAAALTEAPVDLTIAGDGPALAGVEALFAEAETVRLDLGWCAPDEQTALFDHHDVLLCPYDEASQSGTICDALAAAMPTIVTPVGGLPEQIGHGRAGRVLADMSPEALAESLSEELSDYPKLSAGCLDVLDGAARRCTWVTRLS